MAGFLTAALKTTHFGWYRWVIEAVFLPNANALAALVSWGEVLVGLALLLGLFVNVAALAGIAMNTAFLLAGTVSTNSTYILIELVLIFAAAGLVWGLDGIAARRWGWRLPGLISAQSRGLPSWLSLEHRCDPGHPRDRRIPGGACHGAVRVQQLYQPAQQRASVRRRILRGQRMERHSPRAEPDVG